MNGVLILQEFTNTVFTRGWTNITWVFFAIFLAGCFIWLFNLFVRPSFKKVSPKVVSVIIAFFLVVGIVGTVESYILAHKTQYKTYQVLVEDNVKMTEFREKYEILEQQGITYLVKEK